MKQTRSEAQSHNSTLPALYSQMPHLSLPVPGGGLSDDGSRWISGRPNFFLAVRVLLRLFRRLFLVQLR
jgi:hypothetical protein